MHSLVFLYSLHSMGYIQLSQYLCWESFMCSEMGYTCAHKSIFWVWHSDYANYLHVVVSEVARNFLSRNIQDGVVQNHLDHSL